MQVVNMKASGRWNCRDVSGERYDGSFTVDMTFTDDGGILGTGKMVKSYDKIFDVTGTWNNTGMVFSLQSRKTHYHQELREKV